MYRINRHIGKCLLLLLFSWGTIGCEEQANPFVGQEQPYTVFGYLNPKSNTQLIRVIPVAGSIGALNPDMIDAAVITINLETGIQHTWKDSLITFESGGTGHVFVSHFTPNHGESYRLEVTRSDGAVSSAEVTIPPDASARPQQNPFNPAILGYFIESAVEPNIVQADMEYIAAALQPPVVGNPIFLPLNTSHRDKITPATNGWLVEVDLRADFRVIREAFIQNCLTTDYMSVRSMRFTLFFGDENWIPPGGIFDPEVLVQPDLFSNIDNGYGFFGAGFAFSFNAVPSGLVLQSLGFVLDGPCMDVPPTDPSCVAVPPCFEE